MASQENDPSSDLSTTVRALLLELSPFEVAACDDRLAYFPEQNAVALPAVYVNDGTATATVPLDNKALADLLNWTLAKHIDIRHGERLQVVTWRGGIAVDAAGKTSDVRLREHSYIATRDTKHGWLICGRPIGATA